MSIGDIQWRQEHTWNQVTGRKNKKFIPPRGVGRNRSQVCALTPGNITWADIITVINTNHVKINNFLFIFYFFLFSSFFFSSMNNANTNILLKKRSYEDSVS